MLFAQMGSLFFQMGSPFAQTHPPRLTLSAQPGSPPAPSAPPPPAVVIVLQGHWLQLLVVLDALPPAPS